jgi:hypothetical protein
MFTKQAVLEMPKGAVKEVVLYLWKYIVRPCLDVGAIALVAFPALWAVIARSEQWADLWAIEAVVLTSTWATVVIFKNHQKTALLEWTTAYLAGGCFLVLAIFFGFLLTGFMLY